MKKQILILLLVSLTVSGFIIPAQEAQAMDPITIAILTPVAIKVAKIMMPYVIKGLKNLGVGLVEMGIEMIQFFRLPLGLFEISFLAPFGFFEDGCIDILQGAIAPAKMIMHAVTLPILPIRAFM